MSTQKQLYIYMKKRYSQVYIGSYRKHVDKISYIEEEEIPVLLVSWYSQSHSMILGPRYSQVHI